MGQIMASVVALMIIFLRYTIVEGTYDSYSHTPRNYFSRFKETSNPFHGFSRGLSSFQNAYSTIYDTLNSEYSHALYPFSEDYIVRIPVKGGLTVVPAPKNLNLLKGIHSYRQSSFHHLPVIKELPLTTFGGSGYQNTFKGSSLDLSLDDFSPKGDNGYKHLKNIHSFYGSSEHSLHNFKPIIKTHSKYLSPSYSISTPHSKGHKELFHTLKSSIGHSTSFPYSSHSKLSTIQGSDYISSNNHGKYDEVLEDQNLHHHADHLSSLHDIHADTIHDDHEQHKLEPEIDHVDFKHNSFKSIHDVSHTHDLQSHELELVDQLPRHHLNGGLKIPDSHELIHHEANRDINNEGEKKIRTKDYLSQKNIEENYHKLNNDKISPVEVQYRNEEQKKLSDFPSYVQRKKTEISTSYSPKEAKIPYQIKKYENTLQQNKEFGKSFPQHHQQFPIKQEINLQQIKDNSKTFSQEHQQFPIKHAETFPSYPQSSKSSDSHGEINYAGGRYPVRRGQQPLEQTFYNQEKSLNDYVQDTKSSIPSDQTTYQHEEQIKISDELPSGGENRNENYKNNEHHQTNQDSTYEKIRQPNHRPYKLGSIPPRGRSKQYRNYEKPRSSSYEIEILHSESSDRESRAPEEGYHEIDDSIQDSEPRPAINDESEAFEPEIVVDNYDTQESQNTFVEQAKEPEGNDKKEDNLSAE